MRLVTLRALRVAHRVVGPLLPPGTFALRLPGIPGRVHADDLMLAAPTPDRVDHYLSDARSAMLNLEASLAAAGRTFDDVRACLDFPSGYGRVTRHLVARLSPARVTVADVDRQAVRFCMAEFGVAGFVADADPARTRFPATHDLIFVGSLLTHLPPAACAATLRALAGVLQPGGVLVFSTQGPSCLAHLDWYGRHFVARAAEFRRALDADGAAFVPYPRARAYGITILSPGWIEATTRALFGDALRPVRAAERAWDAHQDVWAYRRTAAVTTDPRAGV